MIKKKIDDVFRDDHKSVAEFFENMNDLVEDAMERTESLPGDCGQLNATFKYGERHYSVAAEINFLAGSKKHINVEIFKIEKCVYDSLKRQNKENGYKHNP